MLLARLRSWLLPPFGDCALVRPSNLKPILEAFPVHSVVLGGVGQVHFSAERLNPSGTASLVHALLVACGPAAVVRFVVAVIVDAIQRVAWGWTLTHVSEERRVVHPPATHGDASASVVGVVAVFRVQASAFHPIPDSSLLRHRSTLGVTVPEVPSRCDVWTETTATLCHSRAEVRPTNDGILPAIAAAQPRRLFLPTGGDDGPDSAESGQPAEPSTSEVDHWLYAALNHARILPYAY